MNNIFTPYGQSPVPRVPAVSRVRAGPCACPNESHPIINRATTGGCPYVSRVSHPTTYHIQGTHRGVPLRVHRRRSIRLKNYDYSQAGLYFVTIVTQHREYLFGEIMDGKMVLNDAGKMIDQIWNEIPVYYNGFNIHQFIVMPNHIHGIIEIVGAGPCACPDISPQPQTGHPRGGAPTGLGDIVHRYKTLTTTRYINGVKNKNWRRFNGKLWQRNYWEHIVRNEDEYCRISQYIIDNPLQWEMDKLNGDVENQVGESSTKYTVGTPSRDCPDKAWMV